MFAPFSVSTVALDIAAAVCARRRHQQADAVIADYSNI
jgi:hypothetical protein